MEISGVEISNAAIKLTEKHYGKSIKIHHVSVTNNLTINCMTGFSVMP